MMSHIWWLYGNMGWILNRYRGTEGSLKDSKGTSWNVLSLVFWSFLSLIRWSESAEVHLHLLGSLRSNEHWWTEEWLKYITWGFRSLTPSLVADRGISIFHCSFFLPKRKKSLLRSGCLPEVTCPRGQQHMSKNSQKDVTADSNTQFPGSTAFH